MYFDVCHCFDDVMMYDLMIDDMYEMNVIDCVFLMNDEIFLQYLSVSECSNLV